MYSLAFAMKLYCSMRVRTYSIGQAQQQSNFSHYEPNSKPESISYCKPNSKPESISHCKSHGNSHCKSHGKPNSKPKSISYCKPNSKPESMGLLPSDITVGSDVPAGK